MNSVLLLLIVGAIPSYCQKSEQTADAKCTDGKCEFDGNLDDDGLNLLQRSSSVMSVKNIARVASTAAGHKTSSHRKFDPDNDVYNDVDISHLAGTGSGSSSSSPGSSSSSPSTPSGSPSSPSPTPAPPPQPSPSPPPTPPPSPTPATTAPPSPSPATTPPSPSPATTAAPSPPTTTVTQTQTHHTSTTTTTYYNKTHNTGAVYDQGRRLEGSSSSGPGAMMMCLIGIIIFCASFRVMWRTESAATQMETLYDRADAECKTVDANKVDTNNRNSLVLVNAPPTPVDPVKDKSFDVSLPDKLGLRTTVSVYMKMDIGGDGKGKGKGKGKEHDEQPQYDWTTFAFDGDDKKYLVPPGVNSNFSSRIDLGQGFHLDMDVFHCGINLSESAFSWKSCSFGQKVGVKSKADAFFTKAGDGKYYSGEKDHPKEGDMMVEFEEMDCSQEISVMALQVASDSVPERDTFLPYVLIPHACPCYDADSEQEKEALLQGGKDALDADQNLADEIKPDCWSLFSCSFCFGVMFRPEIRFIDTTKTSNKDQILEQLRNLNSNMKWFCRVVGFLMLFFGIKWMFDPIADVLHFIPLIGGILSGLVGLVIWVFALIMSILIYLIIKIVAAGYFNPIRALIYGAILAIIIICLIVFGGSSSPSHGHQHKF